MAALIAVWLVAAILISTDYRDADGFIDCWPGCTALQQVVKFAFFASPMMLLGLGVGSLAAWSTQRIKR